MPGFLTILPLAIVMVAGPQILSAIFLATSENWKKNSAAFLAGVLLTVTLFVTLAYVVVRVLFDAAASSGESTTRVWLDGFLVPHEDRVTEEAKARLAAEIVRRARHRSLVVLLTALDPAPLRQGALPVLPQLIGRQPGPGPTRQARRQQAQHRHAEQLRLRPPRRLRPHRRQSRRQRSRAP